MKISTIDKNNWYTIDIEKSKWCEERIDVISFELNNIYIDVISFELNNIYTDTKYPIPNETSFIMGIEDAKQLHAWLGVVLNGS
jgi:hypothetical protein